MRIIEDQGYVPGQILELPEIAEFVKTEKKPSGKAQGKTRKPHWNIARQAAAVLVVLLGTGMVAANGAPVSVMTMDVNPSLKYTVNPFDRVIGLDAYNGDGEELMEGLLESVRGKKIDVALDLTLDALREAAYLEGEDTTLIITVSSQFAGNADRIKTQVLSKAESWNENQDSSGSISMDVVEVEQDVMADAAAKGVSPGKLYITRQLNAAISEDEEFDEEEWLNKSVADIEAATKAGTTKKAPEQDTAVTPDIINTPPAVIESTQKSPAVQTTETPVVQPVVETPVQETSSSSSSSGASTSSGGCKTSSKKQPKVSSEAAVADESEEESAGAGEAAAAEGEGSGSTQEAAEGSQDSSGSSEGHEGSGSETEQQTASQPSAPVSDPAVDSGTQGTEGGTTEQTQEGSSDTSQSESGSASQESQGSSSEGGSGDSSSGGGSDSSSSESSSSDGGSDSSGGSSDGGSGGSSEGSSSSGSESSAPSEG